MRICFLCNEYPPGPHGGIGAMTQVLARTLVQAGHKVRVIGIYLPSYPAPDYEVDQGVCIWRLREPARRLSWVSARYRLFRTVAHWSRRGEIDLIEVPDWEGWAAGWPQLPVPVVVRLNGSAGYFAAEVSQPVNRVTFLLERASLHRADFWCSVSRYTADKTRKLYHLHSGPHAILYNAVEVLTGPRALMRSKTQVIFTGTLTPKKGIISLIKAWASVVEVCKEAELHIYGKDGRTTDGRSMQDFLLSQHTEAVKSSLRFHGHVDREKLMQVLQSSRLSVFPSYAEAFALAPLEAMACGCPTIYSRRGSGPELIEHGRDGLLIDPDRPDDIANAIISILLDDGLAQRLGDGGRKRVQEAFSSRHLVTQNEAFYESCVNSYRRGLSLSLAS
jgi:glycosyltransferase involved in cell wall biosynthesis